MNQNFEVDKDRVDLTKPPTPLRFEDGEWSGNWCGNCRHMYRPSSIELCRSCIKWSLRGPWNMQTLMNEYKNWAPRTWWQKILDRFRPVE